MLMLAYSGHLELGVGAFHGSVDAVGDGVERPLLFGEFGALGLF